MLLICLLEPFRMVRALPCSQQLLSSSTGHNGEHIYCKLRPRSLRLPSPSGNKDTRFVFRFTFLCKPILFCLLVLLRQLPEDICLTDPSSLFHHCWLASHSVSQRLERAGDAIMLHTSRHLIDATTAQTHIWTGTSTVPPNQNKETEQTSAISARLSVCL